jgi:hypothetical protein
MGRTGAGGHIHAERRGEGTLRPGRRFGQFTVLTELAGDGMGRVYHHDPDADVLSFSREPGFRCMVNFSDQPVALPSHSEALRPQRGTARRRESGRRPVAERHGGVAGALKCRYGRPRHRVPQGRPGHGPAEAAGPWARSRTPVPARADVYEMPSRSRQCRAPVESGAGGARAWRSGPASTSPPRRSAVGVLHGAFQLANHGARVNLVVRATPARNRRRGHLPPRRGDCIGSIRPCPRLG